MLVAGLEAAVWLLLVNRRTERTALVPRRHRWPWAVAGCFPSRPARVRPRSPSCGGGRARAARTRGSASLSCGGARFRFGTVRVGMRRVGARSTRAAPGAWRCGAALRAGCAPTPHIVGGAGTSRTGPGHNMCCDQGARPRQARPSRVGSRDFASEQFGSACGVSARVLRVQGPVTTCCDQGARPRQARPSRVGVRDFASEQFGAACGASFPILPRACIYGLSET